MTAPQIQPPRANATEGRSPEAAIEDPNIFTRPWTMRFDVWKRAPAGYEMLEYACHEGNRLVELLESSFAQPPGDAR